MDHTHLIIGLALVVLVCGTVYLLTRSENDEDR